jgi:ribonuclease Z
MTRAGPVLALASVLATGACDRVASPLYERAADRLLAGDRTDLLEDGALHVVLCGTGSPLPDPERAAACTAVIAGGNLYLVDVGPGASENLARWRLPRARLAAVLLTHFHSDHIGELGEVVMQSWLAGRTTPLAVYGPPGVAEVVAGFRQAYAFDTRYRIAHHGPDAMPPAGGTMQARVVAMPEDASAQPVLEAGGLRVTAFPVDHRPVAPAWGYRFDFAGRSVVVSGDTAPSPRLERATRGADVLVHEALAAHMVDRMRRIAAARGAARWAKLTGDVVEYHTTPAAAVEAARTAGVRTLVLTHLVPAPSNPVTRRLFTAGMPEVAGLDVVLGEDGTHVRLPPDGDAVEVGDIGG